MKKKTLKHRQTLLRAAHLVHAYKAIRDGSQFAEQLEKRFGLLPTLALALVIANIESGIIPGNINWDTNADGSLRRDANGNLVIGAFGLFQFRKTSKRLFEKAYPELPPWNWSSSSLSVELEWGLAHLYESALAALTKHSDTPEFFNQYTGVTKDLLMTYWWLGTGGKLRNPHQNPKSTNKQKSAWDGVIAAMRQFPAMLEEARLILVNSAHPQYRWYRAGKYLTTKLQGDSSNRVTLYLTAPQPESIDAEQLPPHFGPIKTWIPPKLMHEISKNNYTKHIKTIVTLESIFPSEKWLITSVVSTRFGTPRPGTSHAEGLSVDVVPIARWPIINLDDKGSSPNFHERLGMLYAIRRAVGELDVAVVAEQDHFHLTVSFPTGVYTYPNVMMSSYSNTHSDAATDRQLMKVQNDGTIDKVVG